MSNMAGNEGSILRRRLPDQHLNTDDEAVNKTTKSTAVYEASHSEFVDSTIDLSSDDISPAVCPWQSYSSNLGGPEPEEIPPPNTPPGCEDQKATNPAPNPDTVQCIEPDVPDSASVRFVEPEVLRTATVSERLDDFVELAGFASLCVCTSLCLADFNFKEVLKTANFFSLGQTSQNIDRALEVVWGVAMKIARKPRERQGQLLEITEDRAPTVDVFVVCCSEPDDVVMDTVKAACQIDWPHSKLRVFLADDGNSTSLRQEVMALRARHPNLHYYSRAKPTPPQPHGNKAGNLNGTLLQCVQHTDQGYSKYLAVFDADMIPEPEILRKLVPYALDDEKMGMVTAAQYHYNIPPDDPLNQGNTTGTGAEDEKRDSINAAWCPGSGFLLRTKAWKAIGMFPEYSITEDLITSWLLHGKGWKIALVPGKMQWGLQPDCLLTHLKQRRRWWTGHIPDAFGFKFALYDSRLSGATFMQRYAMFHHACRPFLMTINHSFRTLMILICLASSGPVIDRSNIDVIKQRVWWLIVYRTVYLVGILNTLYVDGFQEYLKHRRVVATGIWMAHHFSRDTIQSLLPACLGGTRQGFMVSGVEDKPPCKERDSTQRPSLLLRLRLVHRREGVLWHLVLFVLAVSMIAYRVRLHIKNATVANKLILNNDFWLELITSVGWPGLALIETIPYYLTPIFYVVFPPTMPDRRDLMQQQPLTGLWKPRLESKTVKYTMAS